MLTREIPHDEWTQFCDEFSQMHQGWLVRLEVLGLELGDQEEAAVLPLAGIGADLTSYGFHVEITLGFDPDDHLTRIISPARRMWYKPSPQGVYDVIEVECEEGTSTLMQFRYVPPERAERQLPSGRPEVASGTDSKSGPFEFRRKKRAAHRA